MEEICKVKLTTIQDVKDFLNLSTQLESDVNLRSNKYIIDAKSCLGILSLNLSNPITVEMVEKDKVEKVDFICALRDAGLLVEEN